MALDPNINTLEKQKFRDDGADLSKVAVTFAGILFDYDSGAATYPTSVQEVYSFYLSAVLVKTITLNYTNSSKKFLASWSKV